MTNEKIEQAKLRYVKNNLEIFNKNKELISMYYEYIRKIVELFDFINDNNSDLFYTIVFNILIEIGFFSASKKFLSTDEVLKELYIKPGISIINGSGVCRNIACFYEDVFKNFYTYPLKMCCYDEKGENNKDTLLFGNHIINLADYHGTIYGFDLLNHCIFKAVDANNLEGLYFDYSLKYRPSGDLLLELMCSTNEKTKFLDDVKMKHNILDLSSKRNNLSKEEYYALVMYANNFISQKNKMFKSFLLENEELTHEIKKKMLSL